MSTCVDGTRDDRREQGELDGRGVDDAHGVAGAGTLEDAEERPGWQTRWDRRISRRLGESGSYQGGAARAERP